MTIVRRETRKQREARIENRKFWGLIIFGLILLGVLAAAIIWVRSHHEEIDAMLCPKSGVRAVHLILIDHTDPIRPQQQQGIFNWLDRQIEGAKRGGERFDVYTVTGDAVNVLDPKLQICSPGRGDDANSLYQNPDIIRRKFERDFVATIRKEIKELLVAPELPTSPILESIRASAMSSFGRFERGQVPLRMTIISDLIQNTPILDQYHNAVTFDAFSRSPGWRSVIADLKGAQVYVIYLVRQKAMRAGKPIQDRAHQLFWEKAIEASDGEAVAIDAL